MNSNNQNNTTSNSADYYRQRQDTLNNLYTEKVRDWLKVFGLELQYKDAIIHIIDGPIPSVVGKEGKISNRATLLSIGSLVRFSVGGAIGECSSFHPPSLKMKLVPVKGRVLRLYGND